MWEVLFQSLIQTSSAHRRNTLSRQCLYVCLLCTSSPVSPALICACSFPAALPVEVRHLGRDDAADFLVEATQACSIASLDSPGQATRL